MLEFSKGHIWCGNILGSFALGVFHFCREVDSLRDEQRSVSPGSPCFGSASAGSPGIRRGRVRVGSPDSSVFVGIFRSFSSRGRMCVVWRTLLTVRRLLVLSITECVPSGVPRALEPSAITQCQAILFIPTVHTGTVPWYPYSTVPVHGASRVRVL